MALRRGAVGAGVVIAELDLVVGVVDDRLHPFPAGVDVAEQRPGQVRQLVDVAIAAADQIDHRVVGQFRDRMQPRAGRHRIGQAGILDQEIVADLDLAGRRHDPGADIAEHVDIVMARDLRRKLDAMLADDVLHPRRMHAQHQDDRGFLKAMEGDVVAGANEHERSPGRCAKLPNQSRGGLLVPAWPLKSLQIIAAARCASALPLFAASGASAGQLQPIIWCCRPSARRAAARAVRPSRDGAAAPAGSCRPNPSARRGRRPWRSGRTATPRPCGRRPAVWRRSTRNPRPWRRSACRAWLWWAVSSWIGNSTLSLPLVTSPFSSDEVLV